MCTKIRAIKHVFLYRNIHLTTSHQNVEIYIIWYDIILLLFQLVNLYVAALLSYSVNTQMKTKHKVLLWFLVEIRLIQLDVIYLFFFNWLVNVHVCHTPWMRPVWDTGFPSKCVICKQRRASDHWLSNCQSSSMTHARVPHSSMYRLRSAHLIILHLVYCDQIF